MEAMGIIFSNIYDSKMGNLTWERTSGSIPFGGRYRQIDFVLSNMSNSAVCDGAHGRVPREARGAANGAAGFGAKRRGVCHFVRYDGSVRDRFLGGR